MIIPVVLSGGSGTRLWPVSRESYPKQFCDFFDENLLVKTIRRVQPLGEPWVVTLESMKVLTEQSLKTAQVTTQGTLFEPVARNTAPAIALICQVLKMRGQGKEVVGIFPADHLVTENEVFLAAVRLAAECALEGKIATLGIEPSYPATGYGYIEITYQATKIKGALTAFESNGFREKPDLETAKGFLEKGTFFWNSGMFVFQVDLMIEKFKQYLPAVWAGISRLAPDLSNLAEVYAALPSDSLDFGVMEKLSRDELVCIPTNLGWSDIGSWDEMSKFDDASKPNVLEEFAKGNYVHGSRDKKYALIGVDDLIVVDTDDAVLVSRRGESQRVKQIVERLTKSEDSRAKSHPFEYRPWGYFEVMRDTAFFKSKIIRVNPSQQLSYQSHTKRSEHWVLIHGIAEVVIDGATQQLTAGQSIYIPALSKHRLRNPSPTELLEIVEVQVGTYFGEDDIIRYEDDYKRV